MASYCEVADLLLGDISLPSNVDAFVSAAGDEIDMRLGVNYVMPVPSDAPAVTLLALKNINVLIASGRLMMSMTAHAEDSQANAYGAYLLKEGHELLMQVATGELVLPGLDPLPVHAEGNAPSVTQEDASSAIDTFYGFAMRNEWWNQFVPGTPRIFGG